MNTANIDAYNDYENHFSEEELAILTPGYLMREAIPFEYSQRKRIAYTWQAKDVEKALNDIENECRFPSFNAKRNFLVDILRQKRLCIMYTDKMLAGFESQVDVIAYKYGVNRIGGCINSLVSTGHLPTTGRG